MTIVQDKPWSRVVCDRDGCYEGGKRSQTLKMPEPEEQQLFIEQIGWLTRRTQLAGGRVLVTHLCPFCAAHDGHPENLKKLSDIFYGRNRG
jgi:hypothetical protein